MDMTDHASHFFALQGPCSVMDDLSHPRGACCDAKDSNSNALAWLQGTGARQGGALPGLALVVSILCASTQQPRIHPLLLAVMPTGVHTCGQQCPGEGPASPQHGLLCRHRA